ncbi:MAG: 4-phosphoerythronate dehydrogenase [Candidatus Sumerlaeia bacterium]
MKIVADENNPFVAEAFSTLGDVTAMPGKQITRDVLRDAQVLACRSTIKINADLLEGTAIKYVGTGTIGVDHFDTEYMDAKGIQYTNAPGCNADSVADYITAALLDYAGDKNIRLAGKTLGVVGCGNVGSRVVKRAAALGMEVIENDPPLARATNDPRYRPIDEIFQADFITLHVPLTRDGRDATLHLANADFFGKMRPGAVLLNASRGAVVDSTALREALNQKHIDGAILDVWEDEPRCQPDLSRLCHLTTAHIAGYSFDGKVNGTNQIYRTICDWLGKDPTWKPEDYLPAPEVPSVEIDAENLTDEDVLRRAVFAVYPIREDDARFRETMKIQDPEERGNAFTAVRKNYPRRREFCWTTVRLKNSRPDLIAKLQGLTFQVEAI